MAATVARRAAEAAQRRARQQADADVEKKRRAARALWLAGEPRLLGTPVDLYVQARGIELQRLGRQPGALRAND